MSRPAPLKVFEQAPKANVPINKVRISILFFGIFIAPSGF
jgi:hypothetical protein